MGQESSAVPRAAPFDGIRIIEFGQFVAVPFAAQLLAEGGAHVIKIESTAGDPTRRLRPIAPGETRTFISRNRGKHSLPLALRDPRAKPVIDRLLASADVALMNFRPGTAEELGLDQATLTEKYPRLIVGTVTAFGANGPEAGDAGMDIVVQARTGLMAANGRVIDGRPAPGDPVSADYMCAMTLSFGVASALLRRERTGKGGTIDTSLMQAAMTLANNQLVRSEEHDAEAHRHVLDKLEKSRLDGEPFEAQRETQPSIRALPMIRVYFRTYDTADSVIAVACGSQALRERFIAAIGMEDRGLQQTDDSGLTEHYDRLVPEVERTIRSRSSAEWIALLREVGVPVSAVKFPVEMFEDPQAHANDMFHTLPHPSAGDMTVLAPPLRLNDAGFVAAPATPEFGSETTAILNELGFSDSEVAELVAANVTHHGAQKS